VKKYKQSIIDSYCREVHKIDPDYMIVSIRYFDDQMPIVSYVLDEDKIEVSYLPKYENSVITTKFDISRGDIESWIRDRKIKYILE
jgi:hypothetical protein